MINSDRWVIAQARSKFTALVEKTQKSDELSTGTEVCSTLEALLTAMKHFDVTAGSLRD